MAISSTIADGGKKVTISVLGKFDFQLYNEFNASYDETDGNGVHYIVDLSATDYLDSSALGMLLLLRGFAGGESSKVDIVNTSEDVKKTLDVANFAKLFKI